MFVPESMKANTLFNKMRENKEHFAVVLDEYGGLSGIITIYDIFEIIFGDFDTEETEKLDEIETLEDGSWLIGGSADLEDVAETIKRTMPVDTYDTFSGFICGVIGRIPEEGESFKLKWNDFEIEVLDVENHIIRKAILRR